MEEIGDTEVCVFDKYSERGAIATIIVRGSSQSGMDDVERAIDDAVNAYKALTKDCKVGNVPFFYCSSQLFFRSRFISFS